MSQAGSDRVSRRDLLQGRDSEAAEIDRLLAEAGAGHAGGLVLVGEAGIGKTALLQYAEQAAAGFRTLRAIGVESEAELPYAGLHALVRPLLCSIDVLPEMQARALRGAFGLEELEEADRFQIGNATLALLSEAAESCPLLCLVDDLQWFDRASIESLLFAVRRLEVEQIAVVLAAREAAASTVRGLRELSVGPLDEEASHAVLAQATIELSRMDSARVLSEARGNPLALRELAGAFARDSAFAPWSYPSDYAPMPVPRRVQALFADRIAALPERTRDVLLVAAADGAVDLAAFSKAIATLGASLADFAPAESNGLIHISGARVVFDHPLVRSAVYQTAPLHRRLAVHNALAAALTEERDTDRRAWHLASGATEPDESVATELVRTAENARRRGGYAAVAAAYERAAELTPDPAGRGDRMMCAARAAFVAGDRAGSRRLVARVEQDYLDPDGRAFLLDLEAALVWHEEQQRALAITLDAASAVAPVSPDTAARLYFEAVVPDWTSGDADSTAASAARLAGLACSEAGRPFAAVVGALGKLAAGDPAGCTTDLAAISEWLDRPPAEVPGTDQATPCCRWAAPNSPLDLRVLPSTDLPYLSLLLADLGKVQRSAEAVVDFCRRRGAVGGLPRMLTTLAQAQRLAGLFRQARATAAEALHWSEELGNRLDIARIKAESACLTALAGDVERSRTLADEAMRAGSLSTSAAASCYLGLLDLGLGRFEQARSHLESAANGPAAHTVPVLFSLPDLVEVAAALDDHSLGAAARDRYSTWADATGQAWTRAIALRCRALLTADEAAAELWERAVELSRTGGSVFQHARTQLLYGTWLRRRRQVVASRNHLRSAAAAFERMGAAPWVDRARTELRATGERTTNRHAANILDCLTPQELQVGRLAAKGLSNKEIAMQLFLSPRTIGYHLYKIFPKLGISTRTELATLIRNDGLD